MALPRKGWPNVGPTLLGGHPVEQTIALVALAPSSVGMEKFNTVLVFFCYAPENNLALVYVKTWPFIFGVKRWKPFSSKSAHTVADC